MLGKFGAGDAERSCCPQGGVILQNSHPLLCYVTDLPPTPRAAKDFTCVLLFKPTTLGSRSCFYLRLFIGKLRPRGCILLQDMRKVTKAGFELLTV